MATLLHGQVGPSAQSHAEMGRNRDCAIVQIHRQSLEEKTAAVLAQMKKRKDALKNHVLVSSNVLLNSDALKCLFSPSLMHLLLPNP